MPDTSPYPDLAKAKAIAAEVHALLPQGPQPQLRHLERVAGTLVRHGHADPVNLASAWLHDALGAPSDPGRTEALHRIRAELGPEVADTVALVAGDPSGLSVCGGDLSARARLLLLAELICVTELGLERDERGTLGSCVKGYPAFQEGIRVPGELGDMWAKLDTLMDRATKRVAEAKRR
jgi:hypothetical protein